MSITFAVPVLNQHHLLTRMLESVDCDFDHVLIIDNGDSDYSLPDYIKNARIFSMPYNLGVAGSWNFAIQATPLSSSWLLANFDVVFEPGSLQMMKDAARDDAVVLSDCSPPYSAFTIGWQVIERVGLFDANCHPAYFEDNILQRRCAARGVEILRSGAKVRHDNSSTIKDPRLAHMNDMTFQANQRYYQVLLDTDNTEPVPWSIERRRMLEWG